MRDVKRQRTPRRRRGSHSFLRYACKSAQLPVNNKLKRMALIKVAWCVNVIVNVNLPSMEDNFV